jgi:CRISPR/Cas system-associated protein Csm6
LKSVDFDGYTEYFNIVVLEFYRTQSVSVYPNPVTDSNLNIQFEFAPDQTVQVLITDLMGAQKVFQVFESVESQFLIPISLEPGTYILRIKSDEFSAVSRIMVK